MSSTTGDSITISKTSNTSPLFCPPVKFIIRCVWGPDRHSSFAALWEKGLVFDPVSNMAIKVLKFPSLSLTLIFWTGQTPGTFLTLLAPSLSLPWTLLFLDSSWSGLFLSLKAGASGPTFGFNGSSFFSLWRERWWFLLHLPQVVPSAFVPSFV